VRTLRGTLLSELSPVIFSSLKPVRLLRGGAPERLLLGPDPRHVDVPASPHGTAVPALASVPSAAHRSGSADRERQPRPDTSVLGLGRLPVRRDRGRERLPGGLPDGVPRNRGKLQQPRQGRRLPLGAQRSSLLHAPRQRRPTVGRQDRNRANPRSSADYGNPGYPAAWRGPLFNFGQVRADEMFDFRALGYTYDTSDDEEPCALGAAGCPEPPAAPARPGTRCVPTGTASRRSSTAVATDRATKVFSAPRRLPGGVARSATRCPARIRGSAFRWDRRISARPWRRFLSPARSSPRRSDAVRLRAPGCGVRSTTRSRRGRNRRRRPSR